MTTRMTREDRIGERRAEMLDAIEDLAATSPYGLERPFSVRIIADDLCDEDDDRMVVEIVGGPMGETRTFDASLNVHGEIVVENVSWGYELDKAVVSNLIRLIGKEIDRPGGAQLVALNRALSVLSLFPHGVKVSEA